MYGGADSFMTAIFYFYVPEILSFQLRAKGMAVWNTTNQLTGLFNAYVNSAALASIGWKNYLLWLGLLFVWTALLYFFMVETAGLTLEEVEIVFLGKKSAIAAMDARLVKDKTNKGDDESVNIATTTPAVNECKTEDMF